MSQQNSNQKKIKTTVCPNCRKILTNPSGKCIYCGFRFPRITASLPILNDLMRENISFVNSITITCGILYVLALALDLPAGLQVGGIFNMFSPSPTSLLKLGMGGYVPLLYGEWWTLVTATYLHGSVLHILFNMLWLRQLGPLVENLYGASRFFLIYTISGVMGALISALIGKTPFFVGASGAVFGLFSALIYYGIQRRGSFGTAIFRQMILWAAIALVLGFTRSGVDNLGHIGGLLGGFLCSWILDFQERSRQKLAHHLGALALLAFVAVCFLMMVVNFFS
jgi:rhomboid protease GluP